MSAPAVRLVAVGLVREHGERIAIKREPVTGPEQAAKVARAILPDDREGFAVLMLNARHEVTDASLVSVGSLNASIVHPREVFKAAILANAASIIVAHNHPSGDPDPSTEDLSITERLAKVGELVGITVLDHVIIGDKGRFHSMRSARQI
jgi:DNA repair protein RadC